jgi:ubiquitin-protein ligase
MNYELLKKQQFLTEYVQNKSDIVTFLLKLTFSAIRSNRKQIIYKPAFPNLDMKLLDETPEQIVKTIKECSKDEKLPFSDIKYNFIVFSIYATPIKFTKCSILNIKNLEQFEILNNPEQEQAFKKQGSSTCYLFHGSRMENWYSIIKNGIKNCSGSKLQVNGAAYGSGVYLSDNISTSMHYSNGIIGVFELAGNKETYKKTTGIYVVSNDKKLILRYFICYNNTNRNQISAEINKYFGKTIFEEKSKMQTRSIKLANKRLNKEYSQILNMKSNDKLSLISQDDQYTWKVLLVDFDKDSKIVKELKKNNKEGVELEIRIPKKYPFEPPFVRVVKPIFTYRTGHITMGGSLCVDILTALGWSPCYTIQDLILQIKTLIVDAEINSASNKTHYTYAEAKGAFERVARDHGWLR